MCGICYTKSFSGSNINKRILKLYKKQRHRGKDGFGFYIPQADKLVHNPRETKIKKLIKDAVASEMLFHHRLPTSTANVKSACHPFSTKDFFKKHNYILVHNGSVRNAKALKAEHEKLGIKYVSEGGALKTFNDSEALTYDIALYLEGKQKEITAEGNIAFIVIKRTHDGKLLKMFFGHNEGAPLKMTHTKNDLTISSEGPGQPILEDHLYEFDYDTGEVTKSKVVIPHHFKRSESTEFGSGQSGSDSRGTGFQRVNRAANALSGRTADTPTGHSHDPNDYDDTWADDHYSAGDVAPPLTIEEIADRQGVQSSAAALARQNPKIVTPEVSKEERVQACKDDLLQTAGGAIDQAIEFGKEWIVDMEGDCMQWQNLIQNQGDLDDEGWSEYSTLLDHKTCLVDAVAELEEEVRAGSIETKHGKVLDSPHHNGGGQIALPGVVVA